MKNPVFWLFCTVIDNYGDIGVAWRLACELQTRLQAQVYLWLDDTNALQTIVPDWQHHSIQVLSWQEGQNIDFMAAKSPYAVIETFACRLPENVVKLIEQTGAIWLNWEYLSAEDWAVRTHLMPSLQNNGTAKYFWQMGFLPETGGLLREADYINKQQQFFRQPESMGQPENHALKIFIFAYNSKIWAKWARAWQHLGRTMELKIANHQVVQALKRDGFLPEHALNDGIAFVSGSLKIEKVDFVPQTEFDERLWAADMLIIRGEDSFVRAQLAGKPFFWHIYPQDEMAHLDKLDAFWRLPRQVYVQNESGLAQTRMACFQAAFDALSGDLNGAHELSEAECIAQWSVLLAYFSDWQTQAHLWQQFLLAQSDAVSRLEAFLQSMPSHS